MTANLRNILKYISDETNKTAFSAREIPETEYNTLCNQLALHLDTNLSAQGSRAFILNPDSGKNEYVWPIVYKSDNVIQTTEDPATRIELFSQIQTKSDWLCKKQVNGQAYRQSSTTGLYSLYSTSSILDPDTGLVRFILKSVVPL